MTQHSDEMLRLQHLNSVLNVVEDHFVSQRQIDEVDPQEYDEQRLYTILNTMIREHQWTPDQIYALAKELDCETTEDEAERRSATG